MDIVKKNIVSIIFGVIALLAIVSLFVPLSSMYKGLEEAGTSRAQVYTSLNSLLSKSRNLPIVNPDATEPVPLQVFPNQPIIDKADAVTKLVAAESTELVKAVADLNARQLLVPGSLPNPETNAFRFRDEYIHEMTDVIPGVVLHAGVPPTPDQIRMAQEQLLETTYKPQIIYVNDKPVNETQVMEQYNRAAARVPMQLKQAVAEKSKIYMNVDALSIHRELFNPAVRPESMDIWWAQVGVWVQRDICESISATNQTAKGIPDAIVKHLVKLEVKDKQFLGGPAVVGPVGPGGPGGPNVSVAVVADPNAPPPKNFTISPTGRTSNGLYDVITFRLTVNVTAAEVPQFLAELSRNRLITVTRVINVVPIDPVIAESTGYYYGPQDVVQVVLDGEKLFLRSWTEKYMPPRLKRTLGIPDAPPPAVVGR